MLAETRTPGDATNDAERDAGDELPDEAAVLPDAELASEADVLFPLDAGSDVVPHPISTRCGDGIRDPLFEECDDGLSESPASCTADCRVLDHEAWKTTDVDASRVETSPTWGNSSHVVAASSSELFAIFAAKGAVWLNHYSESGTRLGDSREVSTGFSPLVDSNPSVAATPEGKLAFAWTDASGGNPDVRLRVLDGTELTDSVLAHEEAAGPQQDPDLLWVSGEFVIAWSDVFAIKVRTFDAQLQPLTRERPLFDSAGILSSVALTPFGEGFAAAARANEEGLESVRVVANGVTWSTEPMPPSPARDRPALVALNRSTAAGAVHGRNRPRRNRHLYDGSDSRGPALDRRSRKGELVRAGHARVRVGRHFAPKSGERGARGDIVYVGWQFEDDTDAGSIDRVFVATAELDATSPGGLRLRDELLLPPAPLAAGAGKIGNMRLAASPLFPSGALISAWEQTTAAHATTLVLDLRPSPFVFLNGEGG